MTTEATTAEAPKESKRDKFRRMAREKTDRAVKSIAYIEDLANKRNHEYCDAQVNAIVDQLMQAVKRLTTAFFPRPVVPFEVPEFEDETTGGYHADGNAVRQDVQWDKDADGPQTENVD